MTVANPGGWVSLNFTTFSTQEGYDFVYVHEGASVHTALVRQYSGQLDGMQRVVSVRNGASVWAACLRT